MLQAGRSRQSGGYRFGFSGMEQTAGVQGNGQGTFYDYKNRDYDPWGIRFKRIDPIAAQFPFYSPYQFAGNKPINAIDLDGLEEYITTTGLYIGQPPGSNSREVRVVTDEDAAFYLNDASMLHNQVAYETLPVYTYNYSNKQIEKSNMTLPYLLDLAQISYSEESGRNTDNYAHHMINREIEFSKEAKKLHGEIIKYEDYPKNTKPLRRDDTNTYMLTGFSTHGIDYVLFSVHMPNNDSELKKFKATLRETGVQIDGGKSNSNYKSFFDAKKDIPSLFANPMYKGSIMSNINARLGKTTDPNPNYEGWRSDGRRNEIKQKSEVPPITNN